MTRLDVMEQVVDCTACELHAGCTAPVFMTGPTPANVAILGQAPGASEDEAGQPFIGAAGLFLRRTLTAAGFNVDDIAFINTVSCSPQIPVGWEHVNACSGNRTAQLSLVNPAFVLCVGVVPTKATNVHLGLRYGRARPWVQDGRIYFATQDPGSAMAGDDEAFIQDVALFHDLVQAGPQRWLEFVPVACSGCTKEMYWMQENGLIWCLDHVPEPDYERAHRWRAQQIAGHQALIAGLEVTTA